MEKKMNSIKQWYMKNHTEITWFLIGVLVLAGFQDLGVGNYIGALVSFGLAYINYKLN
jgi:predicted negative regulator of RcsB-dependent stress response